MAVQENLLSRVQRSGEVVCGAALLRREVCRVYFQSVARAKLLAALDGLQVSCWHTGGAVS